MRNLKAHSGARPFPFQCREQRAAGTKTEKCNRNDHVGEVVPLANGECANQYHLVGQYRRGYQQKRYFTAADAGQESTNLIRDGHRLVAVVRWPSARLTQRAAAARASQFAFGPPTNGTKPTGIKLRTWMSCGPLVPLVTSMSI